MGIYIFSWKVLRDALIELKDQQSCDFGKHIIPYCFKNNKRLFAYEFNGYWKDVGTLGSYWEANMELIDLIPESISMRSSGRFTRSAIRLSRST